MNAKLVRYGKVGLALSLMFLPMISMAAAGDASATSGGGLGFTLDAVKGKVKFDDLISIIGSVVLSVIGVVVAIRAGRFLISAIR